LNRVIEHARRLAKGDDTAMVDWGGRHGDRRVKEATAPDWARLALRTLGGLQGIGAYKDVRLLTSTSLSGLTSEIDRREAALSVLVFILANIEARGGMTLQRLRCFFLDQRCTQPLIRTLRHGSLEEAKEVARLLEAAGKGLYDRKRKEPSKREILA